jgi:HEAT repeat protein
MMRVEEDLPALAELLASDPSPAVRAAAASSLGDAEGGESAYRAVDVLLGVLGDGDASVVTAAISALEDLHDLMPDPRIRAGVEALARHGDPKVRGAVASFREWTEDER